MKEGAPTFEYNQESNFKNERIGKVNNLPEFSVTNISNELETEVINSDLCKVLDVAFREGNDEVATYRRENDQKLLTVLKHKLQEHPDKEKLIGLELNENDQKNIAPYVHDFIQEKITANDAISGVIEYLQLINKIK